MEIGCVEGDRDVPAFWTWNVKLCIEGLAAPPELESEIRLHKPHP